MKVTISKESVLITDYSSSVHSGDYAVNTCEFTALSDEIKDSSVVIEAIFNGISVPVNMSSGTGTCVIPILKEGNATLGVIASSSDSNGKLTKCYSPTPARFIVKQGSWNANTETEAHPSVQTYSAVIAMYNELKNDVEKKENKSLSISGSSTDTQYPSAKAVYTAIENVKTNIEGDLDSVSALIGGAS